MPTASSASRMGKNLRTTIALRKGGIEETTAPQLEHEETPHAYALIATAALVLIAKQMHEGRIDPTASQSVGVEQNLAHRNEERPAKPTANGDTKPALRTIQNGRRNQVGDRALEKQ